MIFENELIAFKRDYPDFHVDELRKREYARLDEQGHVYLDYTGGGLYSEYQLNAHMKMLKNGVFGNPHSTNPTSQAMTDLVDSTRAYVLKFFNASPDDYVVIFTQNASGALKLVGESYPFAEGGYYLLAFDNHNSVNGIREFAKAKGATVNYVPVLPPELRLDESWLDDYFENTNSDQPKLFAYPAQSNFSGVQHGHEWVKKAQSKGWDVLVDGAAFAPTNHFDLSEWEADFVTLSFYKIIGYPTGIGCLLARRDKLDKLKRPWFAGGTITIASVQGGGHYLDEGEAGFEDGTIDYLNLPAIEIGLRYITEVGLDNVHNRVLNLTDWLLKKLLNLKHSNGVPLIHLYGPEDTIMRGGTITINFHDPDNRVIDYRKVEQEANHACISLRTGCFCNPGAGEKAHGITEDQLRDCFGKEERVTFEHFVQVMSDRVTDAVGAVRISVGIATNFPDVYKFVEFAETFIDRSQGMIGN